MRAMCLGNYGCPVSAQTPKSAYTYRELLIESMRNLINIF